jgi:hypothetical protein
MDDLEMMKDRLGDMTDGEYLSFANLLRDVVAGAKSWGITDTIATQGALSCLAVDAERFEAYLKAHKGLPHTGLG